MLRIVDGRQRAFDLTASSILALGWYSSTATLLSGTAAFVVPAIGAVAIAVLMPELMRKKTTGIDRNRAQDAIKQQLELLKMHTMVNVVDTKGVLIEVNDVFLEATGYARSELIGKPVSSLYDANSKTLAKDIREMIEGGNGWQGETALRRRDGSMCITQTSVTPLHDDQGTWIGSISARTDITKATQLKAEHDTALTLHELRDEVWIIDETSLAIKYMNRAAKRRFGWNPDSYKGLTLPKMVEDRDCVAILDMCRDLQSKGQSFAVQEVRIFDVPFELSIKRLNIGERDSRFLIMMHDISDRIAQQRQQADFISMVSHELRSPLTSIKGAMGLLLSKAAGELPPRAENLLEISHRNAERLVLIINDILHMEKIASGRMDFEIDQVDMADLVREALRANATAHQRYGMNLRCTGIDAPVLLETDANRIIQVLTNLLSNAAKFSAPGGTIDVDVEKTSDTVRVSVRDHGTGIPAHEQHKIFQRFADLTNSERSSKGGTGLGLSICKAILESLGGTIEFESKEGQGTTFTFILPVKSSRMIPLEDRPALRNAS